MSNEDGRLYRIVPIGSANPQGWAIERDGQITRTGPSLEVLGAWLDAILAGASEYDADDIGAGRGLKREALLQDVLRH